MGFFSLSSLSFNTEKSQSKFQLVFLSHIHPIMAFHAREIRFSQNLYMFVCVCKQLLEVPAYNLMLFQTLNQVSDSQSTASLLCLKPKLTAE